MTDASVVGAAIGASVAAWAAWWPVGVLAGAAVAVVVGVVDLDSRRWMLVAVVVLVAVVGWRAEHSRSTLVAVETGPVAGWVTVVGDPRPSEQVTRVVVRLDGDRLETWVRNAELRAVVDGWRNGDRLLVVGDRRPLPPERAERVAWQHVVGELRLHGVVERGRPAPVERFSNAVRRAVDEGSTALPAPHDALLRGLVIGDRRGQPPELVDRFRQSGLSHLTVASGLNVALLLAAASPALTRLRPAPRWLVTVALVAWFASLTRFEPSILRASVMAMIASTAFLLGRDRSPVRLLALAVLVLLLVDPLLVRSLGFRLSVGATWGVAALGPRLSARLPGPDWIARPLGVTLGAQAGVAAPLVSGIGQVPLVSVPANLLAVPVASLVKLYGLPATIVAGTVPGIAAPVMAPCALGVWWVDEVATRSAAVEPSGAWSLLGWTGILVVVGVVWVVGAPRAR